jgi:F-type H+-transporting ATPase subunit delta
MNETKIANRYAKALFDLALELGLIEKVREDAQLLHEVCNSNKDFVFMLRSPVIRVDKKSLVIREIFSKHLQEISLNFLMIITRNKRERLIPEIFAQFIEIYKVHNNIISVEITTVSKIDETLRTKILSLLEKRANATIDLTEKLDEEIIGGFVIAYEDKQYDASILKQIKNLRQEFDINLYKKGF